MADENQNPTDDSASSSENISIPPISKQTAGAATGAVLGSVAGPVGAVVGGVIGATAAFWFAGLYQDWLTGWDALVIGFLVAITAPFGDLFESLIKRDLAVKDTGTLFGAHGGVLDRLDAVLFTVVVGYYAAVGLGYG